VVSESVESLAKAIESQAPTPTGAEIKPPEPLDREGQPFNSSLHVTRPDGSPDLGPGGRLKRRAGRPRRGRVAGEKEGSSLLPPAPMAGETADTAATAAAVTVASLVGLAAMLGGAHWQASRSELAMLTDAWTNYYRARGVVDLPPEVALLLVVGAYGMATEARRADLTRAAGKVGLARPNRRDHGLGKDAGRAGADSFVPAA